MEAAGLTVGVIALAGVFKDIIDLYSLFSASKELRQDHHLLETKLGTEKAVLLQWAVSVRLLSPDYDQRLDDLAIPIRDILNSIRQLLSDASDLQQKYGVSKTGAREAADDSFALQPVNSQGLTRRFMTDFENLQVGLRRDSKISSSARFRWVIKDKQKFIELVENLEYFNKKLRELVPAEVPSAVREARTKTRNETEREEEEKERREKEIARRILERLWFRAITDRHDSVDPSHEGTFQWALETPAAESPWDDLGEWMRIGSGIYWLCGKAGSGKSTLMKYLYYSEKTQFLLKSWGGIDVLIGNHFFWYLGTTEQKTQDGLQRSILHQLLWKNSKPQLIREALPGMWLEVEEKKRGQQIRLPTRSEVEKAIQVLGKSDNPRHVCLFIDGLDEYTGEFKHIKIIVSSRPIPEIVPAFKQQPHLMLHDLTRGDIKLYVDDELRGHPDITRLLLSHHKETTSILDDLVDKSDGVFLWVVLATRVLKEGLADGDHVGELRRFVNELPKELSDMFERMIKRRKSRHSEQGAKILKMCYYETKRRGSEDLSEFPSMGLARLDESMTSIQDYTPNFDSGANIQRLTQLENRLRSRTGGLVELGFRTPVGHKSAFMFAFNTRIKFMHRTVWEYLHTSSVWDTELLTIKDAGFNVWATLSLCFLVHAICELRFVREHLQTRLEAGLTCGSNAYSLPCDRDTSLDGSIQHRSDIFTDLGALINLCREDKTRLPRDVAGVFEQHGHYDPFHVSVILAVEFGAEAFLARHPATVAELRKAVPRCGCRNLGYYSTEKPFQKIIIYRRNPQGLS